MKMQEVIAKLREEAPFLDRSSKIVDEEFQRLCGLMDDFCSARSATGRRTLAAAIGDEMNVFCSEYRTLRHSIETLCLVNAEYKEKLGPRTKKPKDAEGQMILPGMEQPAGESPATEAVRAEMRIAGGRHG